MVFIPSEFAIAEVYMPPLLVAAMLSLVATSLTARVMNHYRWSQYVTFPGLFFVAVVVIYTILIGTVFLGG